MKLSPPTAFWKGAGQQIRYSPRSLPGTMYDAAGRSRPRLRAAVWDQSWGRGMADHTTSKLAVRGCNIGLMRGGAGEPLLILHGASGAGAWLPFMRSLAEKFDVIVPEHPGFGDSDTPDWLDTIHDLAYFYLDFLDHLISTASISSGSRSAAGSRRNSRCAHAAAGLADACRRRRHSCRRRRADRHVPAHRRAAHPRLLPRPEARRRDGRAAAAARA